MTPNLILLEARIRKELDHLEKLVEELRSVNKIKDPGAKSFRPRVYASILHDFYSGMEKIFINIAREIDHSVPADRGWHRELLDQMTLDIPDKRPAVLDDELASRIRQYLSFRHRFRNLYGYELEPDRLEELTQNMGGCLQKLKRRLEAFFELLPDITEPL
ncbi:MAG: hypothetical protein K6T66_15445 [Peptococcaceae bacterium]|nr:hypothetical protein [Peptococcaceae bacterium]